MPRLPLTHAVMEYTGAHALGRWAERMGDAVKTALAPIPYVPATRFTRTDYAIATGFAAIAVLIAAVGPSAFDPRVLVNELGSFFSSDPERVLASMFDARSHHHHRTFAHPLFSIVTFPIASGLAMLGIEQITAATILLCVCAAASAGLFYLALRGLGFPLLVCSMFTGVLMATGGFLHWYSFIETFSYSGLTVIVMLLMLTSWRRQGVLAWALASGGTLSMLTSNWVFGIVSAFFRLNWSRFVTVSLLSFGLVASLALVQKFLFPTSSIFFHPILIVSEFDNEMQFNMEADGFQRWTPRATIWFRRL